MGKYMKRSYLPRWGIVLILIFGAYFTLEAQGPIIGKSVGWIGITLRGATHFVSPPAYLLSSHITTATTTIVKSTAAVLGCIMVNTAGAAGSTIKLYNGAAATSPAGVAFIDATQVGRLFCYGVIFPDGIVVVTASGGVVPDVTVTYH